MMLCYTESFRKNCVWRYTSRWLFTKGAAAQQKGRAGGEKRMCLIMTVTNREQREPEGESRERAKGRDCA